MGVGAGTKTTTEILHFVQNDGRWGVNDAVGVDDGPWGWTTVPGGMTALGWWAES